MKKEELLALQITISLLDNYGISPVKFAKIVKKALPKDKKEEFLLDLAEAATILLGRKKLTEILDDLDLLD